MMPRKISDKSPPEEISFCPRCNSQRLLFYDTSFECLECQQEFDIADYQVLEDKNDLLSIQEKKNIIDALGFFS